MSARDPGPDLPKFSVIVLGSTGRRSHPSIKAQHGVTVEVVASADEPGAIADAVGRARGEFVCFLGAADRLHPDALAHLGRATDDAEVDVVYSDEDLRSASGRRHDPFFKPDWSPTRLFAQPYVGRATAFRRSLLDEAGGVDATTGSAWEWDLMLRVSARARNVCHLPELLYHRGDDLAPPHFEPQAVERVVAPRLEDSGIHGRPEFDGERGVLRILPRHDDTPMVSIVIPSAGAGRLVRGRQVILVHHCIESIIRTSTYPNYEIVCVVDQSINPQLRQQLQQLDPERVRIVPYDRPFNFSSKINLGAMAAHGDFVLMLNDDMEVITPDWIESMLAFARAPEIGAVGATLRFADGRIQHAGVLLVDGNPGHAYYGYPGETRGYHDNLLVPIDCSAVTAACLMSRREVFEEAGGLSPQLPINYNDVDYCLKVRNRGYRVVHTPEAQLFHFESSTRPAIEPEDEEHDRLGLRWHSALARDPYYNPNFMLTADYLASVLPDGETDVDVRAAAGVSPRGRGARARRSAS